MSGHPPSLSEPFLLTTLHSSLFPTPGPNSATFWFSEKSFLCTYIPISLHLYLDVHVQQSFSSPHRRILVICIFPPNKAQKEKQIILVNTSQIPLQAVLQLALLGGEPQPSNIPPEARHRNEMHQAQNRTGTYFSKKIKFSQPTNRRIQGRTRDPGSWPTRLQRQQSF